MDENDILARLKVANKTGFIADLRASAAAVIGFGVANEEAAAATKLSAVESFGLRQGLYTLRRELFYGSAAALAFAGGALKLGLTFDEAEASGTAAFTAMLGGEQAAGREMANLTDLTHQTGVQLSTLTGYAEQMEGFGFSIRDVNTDLKALSDFAERTGTGSTGLASLVTVFDRVRQAGKLTSLDLRTLTQQGVPALKILAAQLHLTAAQQAQLQAGKLIIPAQYALPALSAGIQQRANLLGPNLSQEIGITHSYLGSLLGGGEGGVFSFMTHGLATLNAALKVASQGGGVSGFLNTLTPSGSLLIGWNLLTAAIRGTLAPFVFVLGLVRDARTSFPILGQILGFVAKQTWLVQGALFALSTWYIATRTPMLAFWVATKLISAAQTIYIIGLYEVEYALKAAAAAQWLLNLAMDANPVVLIVVGIAALGVGLYLLVTRVKAVRTAFVSVFGDIKQAVRGAFDFIVTGWNKLHFHVPGFSVFGHHFGGVNVGVQTLPFLANGGDVFPGAGAIVGEAGPELLTNKGGVARVTPLANPSGALAVLKPIIEMYVDGKMIARVVADHVGPVAEASARYAAHLGATA